MSDVIQQLPIAAVVPDPRQPRKLFDQGALEELAASIRAQGILEPLLVRPQPNGTERYVIVAGERRWRAARLAKLATVPAIVRPWVDAEVGAVQLVENLQREDLQPLERARAYQTYLTAAKASHEQLGQKLGLSGAHVTQVVALLKLPAAAQRLVDAGVFSFAHARELNRLVDHPASLKRVVDYAGDRIRWGNVPTTRTLKRYVESEIDRLKRQAAAKKKRKGKPGQAPDWKREQLEREQKWQRERQEREAFAKARGHVLSQQGPALRRQFTSSSSTALVRKIPAPILVVLARELRLPSWDLEGDVVKALRPGKAPAARVAAFVWLAREWGPVKNRLETAARAAVKAAATRVTPPARKGGGK